MSRWVGGVVYKNPGSLLRKSGALVWASPTSRRYDRIISANGFWLPSELALDFCGTLSPFVANGGAGGTRCDSQSLGAAGLWVTFLI